MKSRGEEIRKTISLIENPGVASLLAEFSLCMLLILCTVINLALLFQPTFVIRNLVLLNEQEVFKSPTLQGNSSTALSRDEYIGVNERIEFECETLCRNDD